MYVEVYDRGSSRLVDWGHAILVEPPHVGRRDRDDYWFVEWATDGTTQPDWTSAYSDERYYVVAADKNYNEEE